MWRFVVSVGFRGLVLLSFALGWCGSAQAQPKSSLPARVFFEPAAVDDVQLSPSARRVAIVRRPPGGLARLEVHDLEGKEAARVVANFREADVLDPRWVNEDWLVYETSDVAMRDLRRRYTGLWSVRRDGSKQQQVISSTFGDIRHGSNRMPYSPMFSLLRSRGERPNEIVLGEWVASAGGWMGQFVPYALNLEDGSRRKLEVAPGSQPRAFGFDAKGRLRATRTWRGESMELHWLDASTGAWKLLNTTTRLGDDGYGLVGIDADDQLIVGFEHEDSGALSVQRLDPAQGKLSGDLLLTTPGFVNPAAALLDRQTGKLHGYQVLTDVLTQVWLTPAMKAIQERLDEKLPGRVNHLSCSRCDKPSVVLVRSFADRAPSDYLIYWPDTDKLARLEAARPGIDPQTMSPLQLHRTKARDGQDLPVWVTRPVGADKKPLPAVVLVHGGPWSNAGPWEWRQDVQFLASRGYVVIEPEFRGSLGFGDKHFRNGWRQWGQAMQDDVSDALAFAVREGWVDPARVCVAGASYGGYAALMGVVKDPKQYRCAVAWAAVTDPRLMFTVHWSNVSAEAKELSMPQMIGDPDKDAAMLADNAPLTQASRIKVPVLLAYGRLDERVPILHGERMRDALRAAGNEPSWVVYGDEAHGFFRTENLLDFWGRVGNFLATNLKPAP